MRRTPLMVIAGEFWRGASGLGLADGFRKLGWAVQEIDQSRFIGNFGRSLAARVTKRLTERWWQSSYRDELVQICKSLRPDVFLSVKGTELDANTISKIKENTFYTVLFYPDVHFSHADVAFETFHLYDKIITTKPFHLEFLSKRFRPDQVELVHHGYSSGLHRPYFEDVSENDYRRDLLYVGNYSKYKEGWLSAAHAAYPGSSMDIIGFGWREAVVGQPLAAVVHGTALTGLGYPLAVETARINIGVHFGPTAWGWQDKVSTRTFEIPACRGFMLHIDSDEVRSLFEVGSEIDVFETVEELISKIAYYLVRPEIRSRMINKAYQRCVPAYSYDTRAAEIAKVIKNI